MLARLLDAGLRAAADAALGAARRRPDRAGAARARSGRGRPGRADVRDDRGVLADRDASAGRCRASSCRSHPTARCSSAGRSSLRARSRPTAGCTRAISARFDGRGRLTIIGRKADTIITGGENVAPAEVEAVLLEHPAVADAAVFGRADPEWGEAVIARGRAVRRGAGGRSGAARVLRAGGSRLQGPEGGRDHVDGSPAPIPASCCGVS